MTANPEQTSLFPTPVLTAERETCEHCARRLGNVAWEVRHGDGYRTVCPACAHQYVVKRQRAT
jgi:hypothetical protein